MPGRDGHLIRTALVGIQPEVCRSATTDERRRAAINRGRWRDRSRLLPGRRPSRGRRALPSRYGQSVADDDLPCIVGLDTISHPLGDIAHGQRHAQALREGAFVSGAKQAPPVPRRRAKRHRGPCGSRLASWNVKAGSAAALRSRRSPKCSQKAARQCGLVVRPNDVLAWERCGLAGSAGGGVLASERKPDTAVGMTAFLKLGHPHFPLGVTSLAEKMQGEESVE